MSDSNFAAWRHFKHVVEYEKCDCGKTLEQALTFSSTTMVRLTFEPGNVRQQVVCWDCIRITDFPELEDE